MILDTLNELAAALNDDASFSTTITNSLATKVGLTGDETIAGVKTFSSAVTIHTATDAQLNFKTSDDSWAYMQFLQNDGTRRAFIGMDNDLDTLRINATENGANEIQIDTTTVDINASVDISGDVTVDTDTLKVDSSNNRVGIGTTSPQSLLHLQGSGNTGGLYFKNSYDIVRQYFQNDSDNSPFVITYDGTGGAEIKLQSDGDLILNGTNGDNVGIGTESPVSLLHVDEGDIRIDTASGGNQALRFSEANNTRAQIQYKSGDEQLNFITDNASGSDTTRMTIKSEQDATAVGIGTDSPTTTLDVEGTVSYKHISLTDSSDDLDVSGCTVVECTPSGTDTLGGLTGGVQGQILHILKVDSGLGRIIIEHNEGTGNQDIFLSGGSDVMLSSRGGITLYCNGTSWFALDK